MGGASPTYRNFNPNLEEKLGYDPNKESAAIGGTSSSNGESDGGSSTTKKYYVMVSHFMDGEDNMWDLIRYNLLNNGTITLERKSPHYICEFESFNITGQKTETISTKLKTDLKIKVIFPKKYIFLHVSQVWWDYHFKGQKLLDAWHREQGGKQMTGLRIRWQMQNNIQQHIR